MTDAKYPLQTELSSSSEIPITKGKQNQDQIELKENLK